MRIGDRPLAEKRSTHALLSYLRAAGRRPFRWGECDCFLFVADWIVRAAAADPAARWRGKYADERSAARLIREHGGPLVFADALLAGAGCRPTETPTVGDVALVRVPQRVGGRAFPVPVGAICLRKACWVIKPGGVSLTFGNFPAIRAWALPHA